MRSPVLFPLLALVAAPPMAAQAPVQRVVVTVAEEGGMDAPTLRTLRALVANEMRARGLQVVEGPAAPGDRAFSLHVAGRLGAKVPLSLEEVGPDGASLSSASLTAASLEECDVVVPRLVEAVLGRRTAEATARIATVTAAESRPYLKKPGERFWIFGLPLPVFSGDGTSSQNGFSVGYMYEASHFAVGIEEEWASNKGSRFNAFTLDGIWLPLDGEVSPFLGAGYGYLNTETTNGMGFKFSAGVEVLRLHGVRVKAGFDLCVPLFRNVKTETVYPNGLPVRQENSGPGNYGAFHLQFAF